MMAAGSEAASPPVHALVAQVACRQGCLVQPAQRRVVSRKHMTFGLDPRIISFAALPALFAVSWPNALRFKVRGERSRRLTAIMLGAL
jgi:hypothetical protein